MKVKEYSLKKVLEALVHDEGLGEFDMAVDVGDTAYAIDDISIDTARKVVTVRPGNKIVCFYEEEVEYDDEGLLLGKIE